MFGMLCICISFWDGNTIINVSNSANNSYKPSLYNGTIAWHEATSSDYEILYWDGNAITQITNNALSDSYPSLYNGTIAWVQQTARSGYNKDVEIFYKIAESLKVN